MRIQINPKHELKELSLRSAHQLPWKHYVIDNFLEEECFRKLQKQILKDQYTFRINSNDPEQIQHSVLKHKKLTEYFVSKGFCEVLQSITGHEFQLYVDGAIQLRRMDDSSPEFPPHVDFIDKPNLVMLYYISPDWKEQNQGELILQKNKKASKIKTHYKIIQPIENRLVLFYAKRNHWHRVNKVANWKRYLIFSEWEKV